MSSWCSAPSGLFPVLLELSDQARLGRGQCGRPGRQRGTRHHCDSQDQDPEAVHGVSFLPYYGTPKAHLALLLGPCTDGRDKRLRSRRRRRAPRKPCGRNWVRPRVPSLTVPPRCPARRRLRGQAASRVCLVNDLFTARRIPAQQPSAEHGRGLAVLAAAGEPAACPMTTRSSGLNCSLDRPAPDATSSDAQALECWAAERGRDRSE